MLAGQLYRRGLGIDTMCEPSYGKLFIQPRNRLYDNVQHFIIARDLLKGYLKIGAWE
jgi:hypothetical protein